MSLTAGQISDCRELLSEDSARLVSRAAVVDSGRASLERCWPVPETELDVCRQYLETYTSAENSSAGKTVTSPRVDGKPVDGVWRRGGLRVERDANGDYSDSGGFILIQTLNLALYSSAPIAASTTQWRIKDSKSFQSGSRQVVLMLEHCDPAFIQDMADENAEETYTNSIYTANGGLLSGNWYNRERIPVVDPASGFGTIYWILSSHYNTDAFYSFMASPTERVIHFSKRHMLDTGYADFKANYYFSADGSVYYSSNGTTYTLKDGEAATGSLPADAALLSSAVAGRAVDQSESVREDDDTTDLNVRVVFAIDLTYDGGDDGVGGRNPLVTFGELEEQIILQEEVVSDELPNGGEPDLGTVEDGGRIKTVTRYENMRVENGKYKWTKVVRRYVAPLNDTSGDGGDEDDWFFGGGQVEYEREIMPVGRYVADEMGAVGWEPGDTGPVVHTISLPRKRTKTTRLWQKYFVCKPTSADLVAASITLPVVGDLAGESDEVSVRISQRGKHLYSLDRTVVVRGEWSDDADNMPDLSKLEYDYHNLNIV